MKYFGMPYKGSKSQIAHFIIDSLPPATHFYDLFGGGGAISHLAMLSGKWKYIHYNELNTLVADGFKMFINGEFKNIKHWVSRDEFHQTKKTDPYSSLVFSFGNSQRCYLYCREIEPWKKALHYVLFFNDYRLFDDMGFRFTKIEWSDIKANLNHYKDIYKEYLTSVTPPNDYEWNIERLMSLKTFDCLETKRRWNRLNSCEEVCKDIIVTSLDYKDVAIENDSVIYCDPPYLSCEDYVQTKGSLDRAEYYDYCRNNNCYCSEQVMPKDFNVETQISKLVLMKDGQRSYRTEKIFKYGGGGIL